MKTRKLILGIGQSLRRDDGVGLEVVRRWQILFSAHSADVDIHVELLELPGLGLLNYLERESQVLIVDAVYSGAAPGTLYKLLEADLADFSPATGSVHGWGIAEALAFGRQVYPHKMPESLDILGIGIGEVGLGEGLSQEVGAVIDNAARLVERWVMGEWLRG